MKVLMGAVMLNNALRRLREFCNAPGYELDGCVGIYPQVDARMVWLYGTNCTTAIRLARPASFFGKDDAPWGGAVTWEWLNDLSKYRRGVVRLAEAEMPFKGIYPRATLDKMFNNAMRGRVVIRTKRAELGAALAASDRKHARIILNGEQAYLDGEPMGTYGKAWDTAIDVVVYTAELYKAVTASGGLFCWLRLASNLLDVVLVDEHVITVRVK